MNWMNNKAWDVYRFISIKTRISISFSDFDLCPMSGPSIQSHLPTKAPFSAEGAFLESLSAFDYQKKNPETDPPDDHNGQTI